MTGSRVGVLVLATFVVACSQPPSPAPSSTVDCGPLDAQPCQQAVGVTLKSLPAGHEPVTSIRIVEPSAVMSCPPSGGPGPDPHVCTVIAVVVTVNGQTDIGLIRGGPDGWVWAQTIF